MKRRIKRSVIMTLIYCMGIGGLTLFVGALHPVSYADNISKNETDSAGSLSETDNSPENDITLQTFNAVPSPAGTPAPTPTPSPSPTPTPLPVFELKKGGYPEIEKFFEDYYVAVNSCDYTLLQSLVTDPNNIQPYSELEKDTRFLDDIRDITCYVMKSYEEGAYIVYVYHELKYVNIKTTYPKLDKFYLITDKDGNFKIFTSEMDEPLKEYYEGRDNDEKVRELIEKTDEKAQEAINKDEDLRIYLEALNK